MRVRDTNGRGGAFLAAQTARFTFDVSRFTS
jgi:hypothetical protein